MSYASERKILTPVLRKLADRDRRALNNRDFSAAEQVLARWGRKPKKLDPKLHKKLIEQKREKQSSRASHNQETAKIRAACMERAALTCEAKPWRGGGHGWPDVMDHWLGGNGRRRQKQAVETCWMLCVFCNGDRTANYPSAAFWNEIHRKHCEKYGYSFEAHIEHRSLPATAGGAP